MFFAKSSYCVYSLNWYGRKGYSQRKLYFFQIREKRFILLKICGARSKFTTGSLPRIFNYSTEHFNITGNYKILSFRSLHIKKNAKKYLKGTSQYLTKIGKSLPEYPISLGYSEFFFSNKIQNTLISQTKRHIYNRILNFVCVSLLSTLILSCVSLHFLVDVVPSRTLHILRQKHTSEHPPTLQSSFKWPILQSSFRNILSSFENSLLKMNMKQS